MRWDTQLHSNFKHHTLKRTRITLLYDQSMASSIDNQHTESWKTPQRSLCGPTINYTQNLSTIKWAITQTCHQSRHIAYRKLQNSARVTSTLQTSQVGRKCTTQSRWAPSKLVSRRPLTTACTPSTILSSHRCPSVSCMLANAVFLHCRRSWSTAGGWWCLSFTVTALFLQHFVRAGQNSLTCLGCVEFMVDWWHIL